MVFGFRSSVFVIAIRELQFRFCVLYPLVDSFDR